LGEAAMAYLEIPGPRGAQESVKGTGAIKPVPVKKAVGGSRGSDLARDTDRGSVVGDRGWNVPGAGSSAAGSAIRRRGPLEPGCTTHAGAVVRGGSKRIRTSAGAECGGSEGTL